MAFSGRPRRAGAFSTGAAAAKPPQDIFDGEWLDDDGVMVLIKDSQVHVPDAGAFAFDVPTTTSCAFSMEGERYTGTLGADGKLSWNDGCVWVRKPDEAAAKRKAEEEERLRAEAEAQRLQEEKRRAEVEARRREEEEKQRAAEEARKREEAEARRAQEEARKKKEEQDRLERERQIEAAKRKAAEDRERAVAEAARKAAEVPPEQEKQLKEAQAQSNAGMDKARAAYEAEKARKAAALERARAAKAAEAEAKAAAAPPAGPDGEAKAKSAAGIDRAKAAYEAEKARKAAALERAKAAKEAAAAEAANAAAAPKAAEAAPAAAEKPPGPAPADVAAAKAKSAAGLDKARSAYEAEKARKAAALERVRAAKAAEAAEAAKAAEADGPPPPVPHDAPAPAPAEAQPQKRVSAFEAAQAKSKAPEPAKRPSAFEAAQAKGAGGAPAARPSAFEAAQAKAKSEPAQRPSAFEAAQAKASSRPSAFEAAQAKAPARPSAFEAAQAKSQAKAPAPPPDKSEGLDGIALEPGSVVRLAGLKSRPELNSLIGVLVAFDDDKGRWQLRVEGMGETLLNLKEDNLQPVTQEEFDAWQEEQAKQEAEVLQEEEMVDFAKLVNSKISGESMRWTDTMEGKIRKGPGPNGNVWDIEMSEEPDGYEAAEKICGVLKKQGVCVCEANAPYDLIMEAFDEANNLYNTGCFGPVMDGMGASELEIELWQRTLYQDEDKGCWVAEASEHIKKMKALRMLAENMQTFATSLGEPLSRIAGVSSNSMWDAMLACYTGDRSYTFHLDNPHSSDDHALPDNGLRLTLCYYINPQWSPEDNYNGGGLDVFLTNPSGPPASAAAARRADKLRIAPHADTLVTFLSQRMAHQMIQTKGKEKWFCLWMWCMDETAMSEFPQKVVDRYNTGIFGSGAPADDDDDGAARGSHDSDTDGDELLE